MERYARGDDDAFGEVYDAIAPKLYTYLRRQTRDSAASDDLLQQALLHMHRARHTFARGAEVLPWAFAITRRAMIDWMRRERKPVSSSGPQPRADTPEEMLAARQLADELDAALAGLSDDQRVAFELLKKDGLTLEEAAQLLGTSVAAVKLRAHRAYSSLRATIRRSR